MSQHGQNNHAIDCGNGRSGHSSSILVCCTSKSMPCNGTSVLQESVEIPFEADNPSTSKNGYRIHNDRSQTTDSTTRSVDCTHSQGQQASRNTVNRSHSDVGCSNMRQHSPVATCSRSSSMKSSPPPAYHRHDPHLTLNNLPSYTDSTPLVATGNQTLSVIQPAYFQQRSPSYQRHAPSPQSPASHLSPVSSASSRSSATNGVPMTSPIQYSTSYQRSPGSPTSFQQHTLLGYHHPTSSPAVCRGSPGVPSVHTGSPHLGRSSMVDYLPSYEEAVGLIPPCRGQSSTSCPPSSPQPNTPPGTTATSLPTTRYQNIYRKNYRKFQYIKYSADKLIYGSIQITIDC